MQSSAGRFTVLITNQFLANRTGTEMYVHDLALSLRERGYRPILYSPLLGKLATDLRDRGIEVFGDPASISDAPDLIHGQHSIPTLVALMRFPLTPAIYVGHDSSWHLDTPPKLDRIRRHVVVDHNVLRRFVKQEGISPDRICVIGNGVDMERFVRLQPLSRLPCKALLFSNYLREQHASMVRRVCAEFGATLDTVGEQLEGTCDTPEQLLGRYDVVFAKGRCAREAIAAGAAVIPAGETGIGAMVTSKILPGMRKYNFGRRVLAYDWSDDNVRKMLKRYDPVDARSVSQQVRQRDGLDRRVDQLCQVYQDVVASHCGEDVGNPIEEISKLSQALSDCVRDTASENLKPRIAPQRPNDSGRRCDQPVTLKGPRLSLIQRLLKQFTSPS